MRVDSSAIKNLWYSKRREQLYIKFHHGGTYRYSEVPMDVWSDFVNADSFGKFYWDEVKGVFPVERIGR